MAGFDDAYFASLPKLVPTADQQQGPTFGSNPLVAGFMSGAADLDASLAGFGGAVGRATGIAPLAEGGEKLANWFRQGSQAAALPKYDADPWSLGGMGYQVAKAIPTMAGLVVGGEALAPAKAPEAMAALGRVMPRWLGGAGGAAGEVAEKAGSDWARHLIGGGIAGYPVMAGGAYNQQLANGGPDQGKAALALAAGVPEAAAGAVMPAQLRALADNGLAGGLAKRLLTGGASAGAAGMVNSGLQAALNQPFDDPNMSFKDRAQNIIHSALVGGAVGGLFGAAGSAVGGRRDSMAPPQPAEAPASPPGPEAYHQPDGQMVLPGFPPNVGRPEAPSSELRPLVGERPDPQNNQPMLPGMDAPIGPASSLPRQGAAGDSVDPINAMMPTPDRAARPFADVPALDLLAAHERLVAKGPAATRQDEIMMGRYADEIKARTGQDEIQAPEPPKQITYQPPGEPRFAGPQGDVAQNLGAYDINQQAKAGLGEAAPALEPAPEPAPALTPAASAAPDPQVVKDLQKSVLTEAKVRPTQMIGDIAKESVSLMQADPALTHEQALTEAVRQRLQDGAAGKQIEALGRKFGVLDSDGKIVEQPKETTDAVQERGPAPLDAPEPAGPRAGVREGDAQGSEPARAELAQDTAQGQEPVRSAAEAPAPVESQASPAAEPVTPRIQGRLSLSAKTEAMGQNLSDGLRQAAAEMRAAKTSDAVAEGLAPKTSGEQALADKQAEAAGISSRVQQDQQVAGAQHDNMVQQTLGRPIYSPQVDPVAAAKATLQPTALAPVDKLSASDLAEQFKQKLAARAQARKNGEIAPRMTPADASAMQADSDRGVMAAAQAGGNVQHALAHVASTHPDPGMRGLAGHLLERAQDAGVASPLKTDLSDVPTAPGWTSVGGYNFRTDEVKLGRAEGASQDVMHEVVHPLADAAAEANSPGWRVFKKLFSNIVADVPDAKYNDPALRYAFQSPANIDPKASDRVNAARVADQRAREFMAESWSNGDLQAYLKAQSPGVWQQVKNAYYRMMGVNDKVMRNAFDQVMDVSKRVMDEAKQLKLTDGRDPVPGREPTVGSVPQSLDVMAKLIPSIDDVKDWGEQRLQDLKSDTAVGDVMSVAAARMHKWALGWRNDDAMVAQDGHYFPVDLPAYRDTKRDGNTIREREQGAVKPWTTERHAAAKIDPKGSAVYDDILANANFYGYDFRKPIDQQPKRAGDLAEWSSSKRDAFNGDRQRWGNIEPTFGKADDLQRVTAQQTLLTNGVGVLNEMMRRLNPDKPVDGFVNPDGSAKDEIRDYVNHPKMMDIPADKLEFMRAAMAAKLKGMEGYRDDLAARGLEEANKISALTNQADALAKQGDTAGAKALNDQAKELLKGVPELPRWTKDADTLDSAIKTYREVLNTDDQLPYSSFGRTGEHFVSMRLKTLQDGSIDPAAQAYLQQAAEKAGFNGMVLDKNTENNMVFARFNSPTQRRNFRAIGDDMKAKGLLEPAPEPQAGEKPDLGYSLQDGPVNQARADIVRGMSPRFMQRLMDDIDFSHLGKTERDAAQQQLRSVMMDLLPSDSLTHSQQHRDNTLGFNKDMATSFQHYTNAHAFATSALWQASRIDNAMAGMAKRVDELKAQPGTDSDAAQRVLQEVVRRETRLPWRAQQGPMQTLLALNHAFYLTLSPVYTAELATQIPVLMLPQFGRDYGYMPASKALTGATADAFKVTRALLQSGHGADALLTPEALRKVGLSPEKIDFIMRVANGGGLEIGGWTHAVLSDAPSIAKNKYMQMASTMTTASEVFPRALAALAAKSLHESDNGVKARVKDLDTYVNKSIGGSMFNWQTNMQARHLGVGGFAGPITPLVTKFMSYQTMLMNKLYTEADTAFGSLAAKESAARVERGEIAPGDLAAEIKATRDSSRKFLAGHLAAVTTLAGSLGLPILPVMASAASSLANFLTDDDKYDAERWYRQHLTDAFGPVAAEAIAKGVPRLLGMDLSEHAGEERLLPFSDMLTDKRKWNDVFQSGALRALGSPFAMMSNVIKGGTDIYAGRTLKGMQEAMPSFAKAPFRAYRMGVNGYEDESGHKLPIGNPSATDVAMQVVGITPAKKAAYDETTEALHGLQDRRQIVTQNLAANMVSAFNHHDPAALQAAQHATMDYVQTHPWLANEIGAPIQRAVRMQEMGQAFGVNGVSPRDQDAMRVVRAFGGGMP
jgi:hypothetical protein